MSGIYDCEICGKPMTDREQAAAVTTGSIQVIQGGFVASDEPWQLVFCEACLEKVHAIVEKIRKEK